VAKDRDSGLESGADTQSASHGQGCVAQEFANLFNGGGVDLSSFGVWYRATAAFTGMMETFGLIRIHFVLHTPEKSSTPCAITVMRLRGRLGSDQANRIRLRDKVRVNRGPRWKEDAIHGTDNRTAGGRASRLAPLP